MDELKKEVDLVSILTFFVLIILTLEHQTKF